MIVHDHFRTPSAITLEPASTIVGIRILTITPLAVLATLAAFSPDCSAAGGGVAAVFGGLIGKAVGKNLGKAAADSKIEEALAKTVEISNKSLPAAVDSETRADNMTSGPGRRLKYNYTFPAVKLRDVDLPYFTAVMTAKLKTGVCAEPKMNIFFTNGVTVGYSYRSTENAFIAKFDVTPTDCGYPAR